MKHFLFFTLSIFLLISCGSSSSSEDFSGAWIPVDVDYDFDLTCEKCNEEQDELMRSQTAISIDGTARSMMKVAYLELDDKDFAGNFFGDEVEGTYKIAGKKIHLKSGDQTDKYDIEKEEGTTFIRIKISDENLAEIKGTRTVPEVGEVSMEMTNLEIVFAKDPEE